MTVVPFTPDAAFDDLVNKDQATEMIAYVTEIHAPRDVGPNGKYKLFKFCLSNNGTKKISCCVWGEDIELFEPIVHINEILHISGALTKAVTQNYLRTNNGYVGFELTIRKSTTIDAMGRHNVNEPAEVALVEVTFENIKDHEGGTIVITDFLKQTFRNVASRFGNMSYGSGAITDGIFKVNIMVTNYIPIIWPVGSNVTVTGQVTDNGGLTTITCSDVAGIALNAEIDPMPLEQLLRGTRVPRRRTPPA